MSTFDYKCDICATIHHPISMQFLRLHVLSVASELPKAGIKASPEIPLNGLIEPVYFHSVWTYDSLDIEARIHLLLAVEWYGIT